MKVVYLAGPIDDMQGDSAKGWRSKAERILETFGFETLNPYNVNQSKTDYDILNTAISNVKKADIVLVDVRYMPRENTGTAAELIIAWQEGKHIVGWQDKPCDKRRVFINALVPNIHDSIEEALDEIIRL